MSMLWRVSRRRSFASFIGRAISRFDARGSTPQYDEFFGVVASIGTGQGADTSDLVGNVVGGGVGATFTASLTTDAVGYVIDFAAIETGQGSETTDAVGGAPALATIDTGQGSETTDATGEVFNPAAIASGQGSETTDAAGTVAWQVLPGGWLDSATTLTATIPGLARESPRSSFGSAVSRFVNTPVFADAFWSYSYNYDVDTFGTALVQGNHIQPASIYDGAFGDATVINFYQYAEPPGWDDLEFGTATVVNYTQYALPAGIDDEQIGTPAVAFPPGTEQHVVPSGFTQLTFGFGADGSGFVSFLNRTITGSGLHDTGYGSPNVANFLRYIDVPHYDATTFGTAIVDFAVRNVYPEFIAGTSYGRAMVDVNHEVTPTGEDTSVFGTPEVLDNRQLVYPQGLVGELGTAFVALNPQPVKPTGFPSTEEHALPSGRWGLPEVHNNRQYVTQLFEVTASDGGVFGDYWNTYVENVNREMQVSGQDHLRFGYQTVANTAIAVVPEGFDATGWGNNLAAYAIRSLPLDGIPEGQIGEYTVVYNNARLVAPPGADQSSFGDASIENTRRYYSNVTAQDQSQFGEAFVAFAIRYVAPYYSWEGIVGTPSVANALTYVSPPGIDPDTVSAPLIGQWGLTDVHAHRNIVAPTTPWPGNFVSENSRVDNRNKTITNYGPTMDEWGWALVYNFNQYAPAGGSEFGAVGSELAVGYRTRTIFVPGTNVGTMAVYNQVNKDTPDPPPPQTVLPTGFCNSGVTPIPDVFGRPVINGNVMYPEGWVDDVFGSAQTHQMGVFPLGLYLTYEEQWGLPTLNGTQFVDLGDPPGYGIEPTAFPPGDDRKAARISPYTIWATFDATPQAIRNNNNYWQFMDQTGPVDSGERPRFGAPVVSNANRTITQPSPRDPDAAVDDVFGEDTRVSTSPQLVAPPGLKAFRQGIPMVNNGLYAYAIGFDMAEFGVPEVTIPDTGPHTIRVSGMTGGIGTADVELFNRELDLTGWDSFTMSAPHAFTWPDSAKSGVWPLSTRVHFPEPLEVPGFDATSFGDSWTSFWIREVTPAGFDASNFDYGPGQFADRLRVRHINHVAAPGFDASAIGTPSLVHHSLVYPPSLLAGDFGAPRVLHEGYQEVFADGFDALEPGLSTVTHGDNLDFVCGQAPRAIPPQGFDDAGYGTPGVSGV